jgi:hypothetical protein
MNTKTKKPIPIGMALAGLLVLALASCTDFFRSGETASKGESIPPGKGLAHIRLSAAGEALQSVRTTVPAAGDLYFTLEFSAPGKTTVNEVLNGGLSLTVPLEPAVWALEVKGYTDSGMGTLRVSGRTSDVSVTAGTASSFEVFLIPDLGSGGTGSLSYTIGLPAAVSRAFLGLYPIDVLGANPIGEIDISPSAGGTASDTLANLPQGSYRAVIDLYDSTANKAAVWTGAVHIYQGAATTLNRSFSTANFAACPPVIGDGLSTLAAKLDAALSSASGSYTIVVTGTETDLGAFAPKTLTLTGNKTIHITVRGNGNTVQAVEPRAPLLSLGADAGSNLSLTVQDLTIRGLDRNDSPVVRVNNRGILSMKTGALITGNTSSDSGDGVQVYSYGTFNMSGGAVIGNSYSGVNVSSSATFNMSGGAVSGNSNSGVSVSGTFNMNGGAVSGNSGGGVDASGTFNMSGNAVVRDNTLSNTYSYGREVMVSGTFTLSGEAMPQRVFLPYNSRSVTISGPWSGRIIPIDLGLHYSHVPLTIYVNKPILKLDASYSAGDLASLKEHFVLGNAKLMDSPYTETAITGYRINDEGRFVAE